MKNFKQHVDESKNVGSVPLKSLETINLDVEQAKAGVKLYDDAIAKEKAKRAKQRAAMKPGDKKPWKT